MTRLERFRNKLRWDSISNLWNRMIWRLFYSYYWVAPHPFMMSYDLTTYSGQLKFKTGLPWGRYHPDSPWQYFGEDAVEFRSGGDMNLSIIPNNKEVYHLGNKYYPELSSGSVYSEKEFLYGEFEIECLLPDKGQWPSFWLLGDYSWPPEIDIFEFIPPEKSISSKRVLTSTIHYDDNHYTNGSAIRIKNQKGTSYFGLRWLPDSLEFFYNGISYLKVDNPKVLNKYFNKPMRIVIGTGITGYDYTDDNISGSFYINIVTYKKL